MPPPCFADSSDVDSSDLEDAHQPVLGTSIGPGQCALCQPAQSPSRARAGPAAPVLCAITGVDWAQGECSLPLHNSGADFHGVVPFRAGGSADSNPGHYSPLAAHHSPRTTHHSTLTTHHSPLATHHSHAIPKLQACARSLPPARRAAHVPPPAQQLFIPHPPLSHRPRPPPAPLASPHASLHLLRSTLATPRTERWESVSLSHHPSIEPTCAEIQTHVSGSFELQTGGRQTVG